MAKVVEVWAPTRIDIAGGWTDGVVDGVLGAVCNVAISLRANATISPRPRGTGIQVRTEQGEIIDLTPSLPYSGSYALPLAAVNRYDLWGERLVIELSSQAPYGSGLGGSGAVGVALVGALAHYFDWDWKGNLYRIAMEARALETEEMCQMCGWQDQLAAAYGGLNLWAASKHPASPVHRSRCRNFALLMGLRDHLLLVKTPSSQKRSSSEIQRQTEFRQDILREMADHAVEVYAAISQGRWERVGQYMTLTWELIKELTQGLATTEAIDELIRFLLEKGAYGAKACGAGGPGACVAAVVPSEVKQDLWAKIPGSYQVLDFRIDLQGLQVQELPLR